ncbi:MAG: hypothetical protein ABSG84_15985 [Acidobacteriaceae bacterium]|jgi:hypothetical protein
MNWLVRNLAVMLFGAATSIVTAVGFIFLEARTGDTVFGLSLLHFVPLGTIGVGLVGAVGYLAAALALRLRPGLGDGLVMVGVAAGVVFLVQSAEFQFFMGGTARAEAATQDSAVFARFLGSAVAHSPLQFWGNGDSDSAATTMFFSGGANSGVQYGTGGGDSRVDGIGAGVQGMMATQDASKASGVQRAAQIGAGIDAVGAKVRTHGSVWTMLLLQVAGFAVGGLAVLFNLRSLPHCQSCMLLLNVKGTKTRYFSRSREMRSAVDEVLVQAREKQLQRSILTHVAKGSERQMEWSEYCSTLEIRRCMQCKTHRVDYHARRKDGATWKNIALLGFTTTTLEPVKFG